MRYVISSLSVVCVVVCGLCVCGYVCGMCVVHVVECVFSMWLVYGCVWLCVCFVWLSVSLCAVVCVVGVVVCVVCVNTVCADVAVCVV